MKIKETTERIAGKIWAMTGAGKSQCFLKNENGVIDLSSIMIGTICLSAIGMLVAATTFVVIPWAQDESAKNQLKSVMNAQQAYAGMLATESLSGAPISSFYFAANFQSTPVYPDGNKDAKYYGDLTDLIEADLFDPSFKPIDADDEIYGEQMLSPDKSLCIVKLDAGSGFEAAVLSKSGNIFVTSENHAGPFKVPDTAPVCLGRVLGEYGDKADTVIIPPEIPDPETGVAPPEPTLAPDEESEEDEIVTTPPAPPEPEETTTPEPSPSPIPSETPGGAVGGEHTEAPQPTPSPTPTPTPTAAPVTPEKAPEPPAANKDPKTKKFMFCHHGQMHSNAFNGMVNGHHGHPEDIMPPIPPKNYVGWNWNTETAKIFYNNCKPL